MEPSCASDRVDPEIFFTVDAWERPDLTKQQRNVINNRRRRQAELVCEHCPLRATCLEENLTQPYGIFGGMVPAARAKLALAQGRGLTRRPAHLDEVTLRRIVAGNPPESITPAERREAIRLMIKKGRTTREVADVLRVSGATLSRAVRSA